MPRRPRASALDMKLLSRATADHFAAMAPPPARRLTVDDLRGGVIVGTRRATNRDEPDVLTIRVGVLGLSTTYQVEAWRDEEGNGPGHLFIDEATR